MKTRYVFPKNKRLKRHRFDHWYGWVIVCKCGVRLWSYDCHPITSNPKAYPNEPCKKCEKK